MEETLDVRTQDKAKSTCQDKAKSTCESQQEHQVSAKNITVVRSSKFRHIEGKSRHNSTYITKIPALSSTVPGDSNAFQVLNHNVIYSTH